MEHDDTLILDHTAKIAGLEKLVEKLSADIEIVKKKLDSNQFLLLMAIAAVILDIVSAKLHLL